MSDDEWERKRSRKVSSAPPPIRPLGVRAPVRSSSRSTPRADWDFWCQKINARLWEAIALSVDIDPRQGAIGLDREKEGLTFSGDEISLEDLALLADRTAIALDHLGATLAPSALSLSDPTQHSVRLKDFAAWAAYMKWSPFPERFAAMADSQSINDFSKRLVMLTSQKENAERQPKSVEKPLGTRERNTLLVLIASLAKLANLDLSKPSKAAAVIAQASEQIGAPVDVRTIENHLKGIEHAMESRRK